MDRVIAEESIIINPPKAKVWSIFKDLGHWPQWKADVVEARWISGDPWAKGSTFQFSAITRKRKSTFKPIIEESKLEDRVAWQEKIRA
jgi:hypothetical protein